jgi:hypothetical protein
VKISAMNIKASRRIWMHHCAAQHAIPQGGGFTSATPANRRRPNDHRSTPGQTTG